MDTDDIPLVPFSGLLSDEGPKVMLLGYHFYAVEVPDIHEASQLTDQGDFNTLSRRTIAVRMINSQSDLLLQLDPYKFIRPDGIHPRILKGIADVIRQHLSMIFEQSWESRQIPADWKLANIAPVFKKGKKEDPGNYSPVSQSHFNTW
ncbi:hypothetical protein WISP_55023 [Willisornis vidua]|uniref:Uncharacterized protein n=1 Tax=Willisornis vidua TaxID=1566151 RepID=A0ABQ9DI88_9PASS|nr:hypothetical protein WISP_55023 [Willisornis vidua]